MNLKSSFACFKHRFEYWGSVSLNTIDAAARAAAVSADTVEPGEVISTLYEGLFVLKCTTSAGPHHMWSISPSPT